MLNVLTKLFGTKSDKDIKRVLPIVQKIHQAHAPLKGLTHDALRAKTAALKAQINDDLSYIDQQIQEKQAHIEEHPELDLHEKEAIFNQIDKLEEQRNKELEDNVLPKVLPEAFAIVKETARRFMENEVITVSATMHDKQYAAQYGHVTIDGEQAHWKNQWEAAGTMITWNMLHYDVQLIGGMILHEGKIAEMATGEGKTLVATLPAFLNALVGRGVHIVTVNDYLAKRDAEWMGPIFEFHGLRVECIDKYQPNSPQRKAAYQADITYGTNNEFGFDYLRDNMARAPEDLVQRKHHYAMVDEVDSVLIDDARTPLIISGPVPKGDQHEFHDLKPRVLKLVEAQKKLVGQYLIDAKKFIREDNTKEGGLPLFRTYRGLPKSKPLIKFLSEPGMKQLLQKTENYYLQDNQKYMPEADEPLYFTIDEKHNTIDLTEKGIDLITGQGEDTNFFILPDIGEETAKIENDQSLSDEERLEKKDEIIRNYTIKSERIHTVNQLLRAYVLYEKDTEYIIMDGKVKIIDEQTGRVMEGRRYSDGLHQAIEAKENVKVEEATQTYATITLQNYFRMYHKLAGMTGTAETEAGEFWEIYKLDVVVIPTNKPIIRDDRNDKIFRSVREKFNAVADEVTALSKADRPVLVGTTSVEISEILSRMLKMRQIKHQVLNAKQHQKEADVVAEAGKAGTVTIATNMAGRGTDIKLTPDAKAAGGLAIIGTERHDSRRVDRQLRGRSGRQGDVGSSQFFVSMEDSLMRLFISERIAKIMDRLGGGLKEGDVIENRMVTNSIEKAQKKVEENNFGIRKRLLEYDDVMNSQREVIYKRRHHALHGERLQLDILNMLYDLCEEIIQKHIEFSDQEAFSLDVLSNLGIEPSLEVSEFSERKSNDLINSLYEQALAHYEKKNSAIREKMLPLLKDIEANRGATIEKIVVPFADGSRQIGVEVNLKAAVSTEGKEVILTMEKMATLAFIDMAWKDHLREMDDLKQSVQNAVHEQKDPLLIYKFEGFNLFKQLLNRINQDTIGFLMKAYIPVKQSDEVHEARARSAKQNWKESKAEAGQTAGGGRSSTKSAPVKSQKLAGRNERVTVQYEDGTVKKDVKFKTVEADLRDNKCVLLN